MLRTDELPAGWRYPATFLRLVDRGLTYLEPWYVLTGGQLRAELARLRAAHDARLLVPFARRDDLDVVACWDAGAPSLGRQVLIVGGPGHADGAPADQSSNRDLTRLPDFRAWCLLAVADMLAYDATLD